MERPLDRRQFLGAAAAGLTLAAADRAARAQGANNRVVVGIMGTGGRGMALAALFQQQPGVEVARVCDVDQSRAEQAAAAVASVNGASKPRVLTDFRRILDDPAVDALVIATCNHWHGPAAILACAAGKHVYVEKPCSHNPHEGELMVAAARKYRRHVQVGTQRRSTPRFYEAFQRLRANVIGRVYYAQAWYTNSRPSIGRGVPAPVPGYLDYDLWQGPAPRRPFRSNLHPYNWHWFWHWGNGELGNNGVHPIDLCRWGLGVDFPVHVTSGGGRFRFQDDQETPDTHVVTFTFADGKSITWEGMSCNRMPRADRAGDVVFHGEKGSLALQGGGYVLYDPAGEEVERVTGPTGDEAHVANFLAAIRAGGSLAGEIGEAHKSTLLCHLGNIAHRTGRALRCDPTDGRILGDPEAMSLWRREYEKGWEPKV